MNLMRKVIGKLRTEADNKDPVEAKKRIAAELKQKDEEEELIEE